MSTFNVSILELSIVVLANISDLLTFVKLRMKNKNLPINRYLFKKKNYNDYSKIMLPRNTFISA